MAKPKFYVNDRCHVKKTGKSAIVLEISGAVAKVRFLDNSTAIVPVSFLVP